jgi:manganese oxidase
MSDNKISRRDILKIGTTGALGIAGSIYLNKIAPLSKVVHAEDHKHSTNHTIIHDSAITEGYKMAERLLTEFDYGKVTKLSNGQTLVILVLRHYP